MNVVQQVLSAFNAKVSTAAGLVAIAAVLVFGNAMGWISLVTIGAWAPTTAWVLLVATTGLLIVRAFQEGMAAYLALRRNRLAFSRIEARLMPKQQAPDRMPTAQTYTLNIMCICSTDNGSAKIMHGEVITPAPASTTPVAIVGTNAVSGQTDAEPRIHGGEVWKLVIATDLHPKRPLQFGSTVSVRVDLIDQIGRRHRVRGKAQVI